MNNLRTILLLLLIPVLFLQSCTASRTLATSIPTWPTRAFQSPPEGIVVANAYDVRIAKYRDSKEKEFLDLIDLATRFSVTEIGRRSEIPAYLEPGLVASANYEDSSVQALMSSHQASHAIFIKGFNAFFDQTHVEVTKTDNGKTKEAFYDLVVEINYSFGNGKGVRFDTLMMVRKFHSSRSVVSGLLAAGPSIVSNRNDVVEGVQVNVDRYLKSFFRGTENRVRTIVLTKPFKEVGAALDRGGYEEALALSEKLMISGDPRVASVASYDCAVLLEYLGRYDRVKRYLEEALRQSPMFFEASAMLEDYKLYRSQ